MFFELSFFSLLGTVGVYDHLVWSHLIVGAPLGLPGAVFVCCCGHLILPTSYAPSYLRRSHCKKKACVKPRVYYHLRTRTRRFVRVSPIGRVLSVEHLFWPKCRLQHSQGSPSLSLESLVEIAKGGPSAAGTALQSFLTSTFTKVRICTYSAQLKLHCEVE